MKFTRPPISKLRTAWPANSLPFPLLAGPPPPHVPRLEPLPRFHVLALPRGLARWPGSLGRWPGVLVRWPGGLGWWPGGLGTWPGGLGRWPGVLVNWSGGVIAFAIWDIGYWTNLLISKQNMCFVILTNFTMLDQILLPRKRKIFLL